MKRFELLREGTKYIYRIGKRKAEYFRWINDDLDTYNNEITPEQAELDVQELIRSGFSCQEFGIHPLTVKELIGLGFTREA